MGLFSRFKDKPEPEPAAEAPSDWEPAGDDDVLDDGRPARPDSEPITPVEQARIDAALARFAEVGGEVDILASIEEYYDRAATQDGGLDPEEAVEVIGLVVGEHLVRHGDMDWALISDAFGTDLGVTARGRALSVIPSTIVATRWIAGERSWIPGVVGHLIRRGNG